MLRHEFPRQKVPRVGQISNIVVINISTIALKVLRNELLDIVPSIAVIRLVRLLPMLQFLTQSSHERGISGIAFDDAESWPVTAAQRMKHRSVVVVWG